jgi:hypothetical protein
LQLGHSHSIIKYAFSLLGHKKDLSGTDALLPMTRASNSVSSTLAASSLMHAGTDGRSGIQHAFGWG